MDALRFRIGFVKFHAFQSGARRYAAARTMAVLPRRLLPRPCRPRCRMASADRAITLALRSCSLTFASSRRTRGPRSKSRRFYERNPPRPSTAGAVTVAFPSRTARSTRRTAPVSRAAATTRAVLPPEPGTSQLSRGNHLREAVLSAASFANRLRAGGEGSSGRSHLGHLEDFAAARPYVN